jgi:hypothetical protein
MQSWVSSSCRYSNIETSGRHPSDAAQHGLLTKRGLTRVLASKEWAANSGLVRARGHGGAANNSRAHSTT